ncbi:HAD family hydrolase [Candidatus Leptofilum sp.]|uniref:HAD family hydrolase n=1 Tax=Candidatus Leptofilum sp. TaxID=3241576 RepID=UPI003B5BE494
MSHRENQRIKAVLFDMDDTLIDWSGFEGDIAGLETNGIRNMYCYLVDAGYCLIPFPEFQSAFRETAVLAWQEAKKSWAGVSFVNVLQTLLTQCGVDVTHIEMDSVLRAYGWGPLPGVAPFADTLSVLATLKNQRYKIGLITNAMQPMWMRDIELRAYGILEYLDARLTSGDVGFMKPHPFIYWQALELLEVSPEAAVFVGDRPANDIAGANDAGLTSVLISPPHLNRDLGNVRPNYTISTLTELLPILTELEKHDD